jgi:tRNA(Ile)-lysidine synthetase-like protein
VKDGRSPEEAARNARRSFLETTLEHWPGDAVALGHHLDDQAETVLIRLLSGTGIRGLGGMWPVRGPYIRPLIETDRGAILDYVAGLSLSPRHDETNDDTAYLRNRLRLRIIPELKACNPGFNTTVGRMAELARKEDAYLDRLAGEALGRLIPVSGIHERDKALFKLAGKDPAAESRSRISLPGLLGLEPVLAARALRLWIVEMAKMTRADMADVDRIYELALKGKPGSAVPAGGGYHVRKERDVLALSGQVTLTKDESMRVEPTKDAPMKDESMKDEPGKDAPMKGKLMKDEPVSGEPTKDAFMKRKLLMGESAQGMLVIPGDTAEFISGVRFTSRWVADQAAVQAEDKPVGAELVRAESVEDEHGCDEPFDWLTLAWPTEEPWPELRRRRPGDWLNMPYGRKKLKELFNEKAVPLAIRDLLPLLVRGSQVLWVPGVVKAANMEKSDHEKLGHEKQLEITCRLS